MIFALVIAATPSLALETIISNSKFSSADERFVYPLNILKTALDRTVETHGPFEIKPFPGRLTRSRALAELKKGRITIFEAPTRREWEENAIPVRIPIRKGILGYRLLLIREGEQAKFDAVRTIEDLKKYRLGSGQQWSTTKAFKKLGIDVFGGTKYEPLFKMLSIGRFDYFPRGLNEVFAEFDKRKGEIPNLALEKNLALYLPLPTYFFVTPKRPDLATRLEAGLKSMIKDGTLEQVFEKYHGPSIARANLESRRIIRLENLTLTDQTPFDIKSYWYQPGS